MSEETPKYSVMCKPVTAFNFMGPDGWICSNHHYRHERNTVTHRYDEIYPKVMESLQESLCSYRQAG